MSKQLSGMVAVITGGASGLGKGMVEHFLSEGAQVVFADIDEERGAKQAVEYGAEAEFRYTDVADATMMHDLVEFAVARFGAVDVMVNNAAVPGTMFPSLLDTDFGEFEHVLGVNLLGVMLGTQVAARHMARAGRGSIINISSLAGLQATAGPLMYSASKAAVIHFTKCAALSLGVHGVRVNCIAPAHIETPILERFLEGLDDGERTEALDRIRSGMLSRQPLQRKGTPLDVAEAAVYLGSARAAYITGTTLPVDAGVSAGTAPQPADR